MTPQQKPEFYETEPKAYQEHDLISNLSAGNRVCVCSMSLPIMIANSVNPISVQQEAPYTRRSLAISILPAFAEITGQCTPAGEGKGVTVPKGEIFFGHFGRSAIKCLISRDRGSPRRNSDMASPWRKLCWKDR